MSKNLGGGMAPLAHPGYAFVGRGQQGAIERIRPPPTNSKNRLKSFCEVDYANFRPIFLLLVRGYQ